MSLLLDTATFLWFITASEQLPGRVADKIRSPDHEVWLSVVSFWEIQIKHQLGRLALPGLPSTYIPRQRARHRIDSLPLHEAALTHLPKLPQLHRDPFDRMLVCQAIEHECTIVTSDRAVQAYPVKTWWEV